MGNKKTLHNTTPKEIIDFCLNCTKKKCNGNCKKIKELLRGYEYGKKI